MTRISGFWSGASSDGKLKKILNMRAVWTKAHTTLEEKAEMTPEKGQVAWANVEVNELAKTSTFQDGAKWQSVFPGNRWTRSQFVRL